MIWHFIGKTRVRHVIIALSPPVSLSGPLNWLASWCGACYNPFAWFKHQLSIVISKIHRTRSVPFILFESRISIRIDSIWLHLKRLSGTHSHVQREIKMFLFCSVSSNMAKDGLWEKSQSVRTHVCVLYGGNISLVIPILFEFYVQQTVDKDHDYEFDFLFWPILCFVVHLLFDFDLFGFCRYFILCAVVCNFLFGVPRLINCHAAHQSCVSDSDSSFSMCV